MHTSEPEWGDEVSITKGLYKGFVGEYDDDCINDLVYVILHDCPDGFVGTVPEEVRVRRSSIVKNSDK